MYSYLGDAESLIAGFRSQVEDQMVVHEASLAQRGQGILFVGQLLREPEAAFNTLYERLKPRGYLPFLQQRRGTDSLLIAPYVERGRYRYGINLLLFLAT
ncbi:MAG: hypothetical protein HYZ68_01645, partial [Chloroflexi bacterium]|nr:hypothetical protein [Chloroflexota bacterium]